MCIFVEVGQVLGNLYCHMRLGNVFPHSSCLIKPLYFNVNSTVDQGWRLLNSQIDAVLETKLLVGIIEIGDGCVVFFLVFNRYAWSFIQPVPGRKLWRGHAGLA